jgi:hypothetical protein
VGGFIVAVAVVVAVAAAGITGGAVAVAGEDLAVEVVGEGGALSEEGTPFRGFLDSDGLVAEAGSRGWCGWRYTTAAGAGSGSGAGGLVLVLGTETGPGLAGPSPMSFPRSVAVCVCLILGQFDEVSSNGEWS